MRTFELHRTEDVTGASGTGIVAEGAVFDDGAVALRWIVGEHRSTVAWGSIEAVIAVHGHGGKTRLVWTDQAEPGVTPLACGCAAVRPTGSEESAASAALPSLDATKLEAGHVTPSSQSHEEAGRAE